MKKGKEPVEESELQDQALSLLKTVGIPEDEIDTVSVHRIVDELENEKGEIIGPRETVAFIVYVRRQLNGFLVEGSYAKVTFNAEGILHKVSTSWRTVEVTPATYRKIVSENDLMEAAEQFVDYVGQGKEPSVFKTEYAYVEGPHKDSQECFKLKYLITYSFDSFIQQYALDALEQ